MKSPSFWITIHHFSPPARAWRWPGAIVSPAASASSGRKMLNKCHGKKWCFPDFEGKMVLSRFRMEFHGILNGFEWDFGWCFSWHC